MIGRFNRRRFLVGASLAAGAAAVPTVIPARAWAGGANERLNIAAIGVGGQGGANIAGVRSENLVAFCDVDANNLGATAKDFPDTRRFADFRRMYDNVGHSLDAVVVSTPDHTHAPAAVAAMQLGKHCYCEKPLSHNVAEARRMTVVAEETGVVTQLGTQIHAGDNYRRVVELVRAGAIGPVGEVHAWCPASYSGGDRPADQPPVPEHLDWDLWLGPAPFRPYHPNYVPFRWRGWWDFANGGTGDFFCHYADVAYWALDLAHPVRVSADGPPRHPESTPPSLSARLDYPARGSMPPVVLRWYDGPGNKPPQLAEWGVPDWNAGVLLRGEKGMLLTDYGRHVLLPEAQYADFERPPHTIPESIGHHREWIEACKNGEQTTCHFGYSGPLTEGALLATVAYRVGTVLEWDAAALAAPNAPEAEEFLSRTYREGWTLG